MIIERLNELKEIALPQRGFYKSAIKGCLTNRGNSTNYDRLCNLCSLTTFAALTI